MRRSPLLALAVLGALAHRAAAADPNETVNQSEQVLAELVAIPGKQIPAKLLNEAQGVAIIPRVIKIGFVAGGRRGHGVVLVRDAEGAWGLPRFVTLTGGSVGWQAGVSGTDVVLVFRTRRSVENLLKGKFTIGVDAAAAAGPVGRNAAAATDATLQAEILSYSRSRGLFLGASIDGSAIELDGAANAAYYQSTDPENPQVIPASATQLQAYVAELAVGGALQPVAAGAAMQAPVAVGAPPLPDNIAAPAAASSVRLTALRRALAVESTNLTQLLDPQWQAFLALPADIIDPVAPPNPAALADAVTRFEKVAAAPEYAALNSRPEFQATLELLREYAAAVATQNATLQLPAPPEANDLRR